MYRAHFRHVGLIDLGGEEVIQLDDIGHHAAGGFDSNLEIGKDLLNLCLEIALANDLAGRVARDLARNTILPRLTLAMREYTATVGAIRVFGLMNPFDGFDRRRPNISLLTANSPFTSCQNGSPILPGNVRRVSPICAPPAIYHASPLII